MIADRTVRFGTRRQRIPIGNDLAQIVGVDQLVTITVSGH
jgi:hypothetical protein